MYYDIPEGLGLRKEAGSWGKLFRQAMKRFPGLTLRQGTMLTNQRYANKTMTALEKLYQSRVDRANKQIFDALQRGDKRAVQDATRKSWELKSMPPKQLKQYRGNSRMFHRNGAFRLGGDPNNFPYRSPFKHIDPAGVPDIVMPK